MKRIIYLLVGIVFLSFSLFSCSDENSEILNNDLQNVVYSGDEEEYKPIEDYTIDNPRIVIYFQLLKVPKRISPTGGGSGGINCSFGLGFCFGIYWADYQVSGPSFEPKVLEKGDVSIIYKIDKDNKKVILYLPSDLTSLQAFTQSDVTEFTVYEDMEIESKVILKSGDYPVGYDSKGNLAYVIDMY